MNNGKISHAVKPFWSWNDKLTKEELCSQIEAMKEVGINGFFMHARGGLITEYMGDDWFDCIKACMDKAKELGMEAWAYDENGWPSGFGDGVVPAKGVDYQQKWIILNKIEDAEAIPENAMAFYRISGSDIILTDKPEVGGYVISMGVNPYYIDTFNAECIAYFIECTHNKYYDRFSEEFGKSLNGFFTDEPQYAHSGNIPWSFCFPEYFKNKYGYDLVEKLPLIFIDTEGSYALRHDFYNMIATLFRESFIKQMYDWCTDHNCKLTGHLMCEDSIIVQMNCTGGVMPCYQYFHEPGIDWLGRAITAPLSPKQLGSVSKQLGRKSISESFALCGWDVSLNELKWIAQWQFVNGVTTLCPHLEGYSLRGIRKRDYPASLFVQLPWFKKAYPKLSDYFCNLGELLDEGEENTPLLMLHPIQSAYLLRNPWDGSKLYELDQLTLRVAELLNGNHILHHYGDEEIFEKYGSVDNAAIKIGNCSYKAVFLPGLVGITSNTADALIRFADNGGKIYYLGSFPQYIDGREDERIKLLSEKSVCVQSVEELKSKLAGFGLANIITDSKENTALHYAERSFENGERLYYIVNLTNEPQTARFILPYATDLSEWDIVEDTTSFIKCKKTDASTETELELAPYGSIILKNVGSENGEDIRTEEKIALSHDFKLQSVTPNALTLDMCEYRIDEGEWQSPRAVILLQNDLLALKRPCDIEMRFKFRADYIPEKDVKLCMEMPGNFKFSLNGKPFEFKEDGWYRDKAFRTSEITPYIIKGENELVVSGEFYQNDNVYRVLFTPNMCETELNKLTYDTELESMYIIGDFAVDMAEDYTYGERRCIHGGKEFTLVAPKTEIDATRITEQGYWFFSGEMALEQTVEIRKRDDIRYTVELSKLNSPAAELFVNGKSAGILAFAPYKADVTELLNDGENTVTINLLSGNRNLMGPHHRPYGESYFVGPDTFSDQPGWTDDPNKPAWTDNYSFVKFGIEL